MRARPAVHAPSTAHPYPDSTDRRIAHDWLTMSVSKQTQGRAPARALPSTEPPAASMPAAHENRRLAGTTLALGFRQVVSWGTATVAMVFIPRHLGPLDFGLLATATAIGGYVALFAGAGLNQVLTQRAARDPGSARALFRAVTKTRMALMLVVTPIALGVGFAVFDRRIGYVLLLSVLVKWALDLVSGAVTAIMQGQHRLGPITMLHSVMIVVSQAAIVAGLAAGFGLWAPIVVGPIWSTIVLVLTIPLFARAREFPARRDLPGPGMSELLRAGLPFLAFETANTIFGFSDVMLLAFLTDPTIVGSYTFAWRLSAFIVLPASILGSALLPTLTVAPGRDPTYGRRLPRIAIKMVLLFAVPAAFGIALLAPAITVLVGGHEFASSGTALRILAMAVPLTTIGVILGTNAQATGRQRDLAFISWGAVALNVGANLAVIPMAQHYFGDGGIGAAATTVLTEVYMTGAILVISRGTISAGDILTAAWRPVVASALMAGVLVAVGGLLPLLALIAVGAATYGLCALAVRATSLAELKGMLSTVRARGGA